MQCIKDGTENNTEKTMNFSNKEFPMTMKTKLSEYIKVLTYQIIKSRRSFL